MEQLAVVLDKKKFAKEVEERVFDRLERKINEFSLKRLFYKRKEVAIILGVTPVTILHWEERGILRGCTVVDGGEVLYKIEDVRALVANLEEQSDRKFGRLTK
jgi:hypothetical protein